MRPGRGGGGWPSQVKEARQIALFCIVGDPERGSEPLEMFRRRFLWTLRNLPGAPPPPPPPPLCCPHCGYAPSECRDAVYRLPAYIQGTRHICERARVA
jgi:hypothetical protein